MIYGHIVQAKTTTYHNLPHHHPRCLSLRTKPDWNTWRNPGEPAAPEQSIIENKSKRAELSAHCDYAPAHTLLLKVLDTSSTVSQGFVAEGVRQKTIGLK